MPLQEIISLLTTSEMRKYLSDHAVKNIWITGSYARNQQTEQSDVDLLCKFDNRIDLLGLKFFDIGNILEEKIGKKVDILDYDHINPYIKDSVLHNTLAVW